MDGILLGQYVPGHSFLHKLDPRTKIAAALASMSLVFALKEPVGFALFAFIVISLYFSSGVAGSMFSVLKPGLYLLVLTVVINMLFYPGHILFEFGMLAVTREGIIFGLQLGLKLLLIISVSSLITLTTSPVRITDGLERMLGPLRKLRVPVSELAMMINIALRFIPSFWQEIDIVIKAQAARGADFRARHPGRRLRYYIAFLVPLFISAFRKAEELSVAMEARGYVVGMPRTSLHQLKMTKLDYITFAILFLIIAAVIFNRYFV